MKYVKKIMNNNIIIFAGFIFIQEVLFKMLTGTLRFDYSLIRILISSYLLSYIVNLIKNIKVKKIVSFIVSLIITVYAIVQLGFNNFLGGYMSINTSSQLGKVTDYIADYIKSFKINYYLLLLPLILFGVYLVINKKFKDTFNKKSIAVIPAMCVVYFLTLVAPFMQNKYQYASNISLFKSPSIASVSVNQFGVGMFGVLDVKAKLTGGVSEINIEDEEVVKVEDNSEKIKEDNALLEYLIDNETDTSLNSLNKYFYSNTLSEQNEYSGIYQDKNLILVLMESVGELGINEEYFPTLYKLYNEGITFTNNYSPRTSCSTGNNEFSTLTGLYAIGNLCTSNIYKNNTYMSSIFNLFNNEGYDSYAFHDYTEKYYVRSEYMPNFGATYYGVEDLGIEYDNAYKEWPSDRELVRASYDIFSSSEKYMSFLVTVSPHQPYGVSSTLGNLHLDEFVDSTASINVKRYYSKLKELDTALSELLQKLSDDGTLDDTVIVLFGDHYPYGLNTDELQEEFDYDISKNSEIERTPLIIYNSETEGKKIDKYTTYIDILPTLANMFGLEYDSRFYMGEDAMDEKYSNIAVFPDGSWQSEYAYYDAETSKIEYIKEGYIYQDEEILSINQKINKKITMSNLAVTKNYFSYLERKYNEFYNINTSEDNTTTDDDIVDNTSHQ